MSVGGDRAAPAGCVSRGRGRDEEVARVRGSGAPQSTAPLRISSNRAIAKSDGIAPFPADAGGLRRTRWSGYTALVMPPGRQRS